MLICDEVVPREAMERASSATPRASCAPASLSAVSNRKALRVAQEPLADFRRYMATYARQQALCFYDPGLLANIEAHWKPQSRRMVVAMRTIAELIRWRGERHPELPATWYQGRVRTYGALNRSSSELAGGLAAQARAAAG